MSSSTAGGVPVVAHVMRTYLRGTETFVQNQLTTLRRHRAVVLCHHREPESAFGFDDIVTARDVLSPLKAGVDSGAYRAARVVLPATTSGLARAARAAGAGLLHFHFLTDARLLLGVKRKTRLPAVVSAYGYDVSEFPARWWGLGRRYLRAIFEQCECFLAMSEDMRLDLLELGCPAGRIRVHYHGSDTRRFRYPARDYRAHSPLTVLCCGRLEPRKGQDLVLRALRLVEGRSEIAFRVVIVGEGELRPRLERMVAAYGWGDRVVLTGHVPYTSEALVRHFHDADVFALPSVTASGLKEGIPGVVVEAMAAALPVVSSRHAGIPAVLAAGRDGLLVEEGDVEGLAGAFERLLTDASLRERLGRAAAGRAASELDVARGTAELEAIYDSLL